MVAEVQTHNHLHGGEGRADRTIAQFYRFEHWRLDCVSLALLRNFGKILVWYEIAMSVHNA
jgi:hypothetical protein